MAVKNQAQTTIFDKTIEDPAVEEAVETLMAAKAVCLMARLLGLRVVIGSGTIRRLGSKES